MEDPRERGAEDDAGEASSGHAPASPVAAPVTSASSPPPQLASLRAPSRPSEPPEPAAPSLVDRLRAAPVTTAITALNFAVFLWAGAGKTTNVGTLLEHGASEPMHVWAGEYWRVATCMFLHIGWMHILWNSYGAFGWCAPVERLMGARRFLLVYLASGVAGGCASVAGGVLAGHPATSAGASGALFGMIGATLAVRRRQLGSFQVFFADPGVRTTLVSMAIWTVIGMTALAMDNWAHGGGLVAGAVATWLMMRRGPSSVWVGYAAGLGALFIMAARPWATPTREEHQRLAAYVYAYAEGGMPRSDGTATPWPKNRARAIRLAKRSCDTGGGFACGLLAEIRRGELSPDEEAALTARACELEPRACEAQLQTGEDGAHGAPPLPIAPIAPVDDEP